MITFGSKKPQNDRNLNTKTETLKSDDEGMVVVSIINIIQSTLSIKDELRSCLK